jgi:pyridoxamine 5'-phosphate oxidase
MWVMSDLESRPESSTEQPRLADLRVHYDLDELYESDLAATPLEQFRDWFARAHAADVMEPNAMVVATADADGVPTARTVLLKEADARGFTFYTNLTSTKSRQIEANPWVSAVFGWYPLHRQVIVTGRVEPVPREEAAAYFGSRPRGSQIGAWASRQSTVVSDRAALDERYARLEERFADGEVPMPEFWGGWLIRPMSVEFWQGRASRLHDRLRYVADHSGASLDDPAHWTIQRLSP